MFQRRRSSFFFLASKGGGIPLMFAMFARFGRRSSSFVFLDSKGDIPLMFARFGRRSSRSGVRFGQWWMGFFVIFFRAWIVFGHVPIKRVAALVSGGCSGWCLVGITLMFERRRSSFVFLASKGGGIPLMFRRRRSSFFILTSKGGGITLMFRRRRSSLFVLASKGGLACGVLRWCRWSVHVGPCGLGWICHRSAGH